MCLHMKESSGCEPIFDINESIQAFTYVCLGLLRTSPSSVTIPTPILLADPSIPKTSFLPFDRGMLSVFHDWHLHRDMGR